MNAAHRRDLVHDLFLPTLLFAALGGMSWAVRGSSGYGAMTGCVFAGVLWGAAWWFISRDPGREPQRRFTSGWIVLAVAVGVGLSGSRGWMQWPSFFEGKILTNAGKGEFLPISRGYGFLWLFIAGVPWAGIGACLLAWCGSLRTSRAWHWGVRIACGIGAGLVALFLYETFPQLFLPMYDSLAARYQDVENNPNLRRLTNDSRFAIVHLGIYLGLLGYEIGRKDWKNVLLIGSVGLINGAGWSLLQNWKWAAGLWPDSNFNWWRCWESSGGISIGIAYGLAFFLVNRRLPEAELAEVRKRYSIERPNFEWLLVYLVLTTLTVITMFEALGAFRALRGGADFALLSRTSLGWGLIYFAVASLFGVAYVLFRDKRFAAEPAPPTEAYGDPNLERFGLYVGLLLGLGLSIRAGIKGWFNIYRGDEEYWSGVLWQTIGPACLLLLVGLCCWTLFRPLPRNFQGDIAPRAGWILCLVLFVQNILAQLVTGPWRQWNEVAFNLYYLLLFAISGVILIHYATLQRFQSQLTELPAKKRG